MKGGKYKFSITRAQKGEDWFSFHMVVDEVVADGEEAEVGLQVLMFRSDPSARFEDKAKRDKALEEMKHLVWSCGKEGFKDVEELIGASITCKVTHYSYTGDDGEEVEKNGFYPQLPEAAPLSAAVGW